ncbi:YhjD/YihY/BrkB family envelope integrity protein [Natronomonas sp. EA1]|uniref:YihY/virulence factor BrkB family protein n=1 Tax=Natronomonas sp. EA1 TaxID=3421655 RepID=UPI003EBA7B49
MNRTAGVVDIAKAVVHGVQSDRITFIAASLAYYAFISLLPLLLLALVAAAVFGGPTLVDAVAERVTETLGPQAGTLVIGALTNAAGRGGATLVGLAVLLWSALKLFRGLDVAFSIVYGAAEGSFFHQLQNATVTFLAVGVGVAATVVVGALIALVDLSVVVAGIDLLDIAATLLLLAGLTVTFLPLYYVLPARGVTVREALPGAVFAALGWTALQTGFRLYASMAGSYEAYGVLGGVLLLITWLYFGALVLLVGVVLNAALAGRISDDTDLDNPATPMGDDTDSDNRIDREIDRDRAPDELTDEELADELERLRVRVATFEEQVDDRTVHRDEIERDLKRYVRRRVRSGKARGWGPYLVLLYGTAMTLGAFYWLSSGWAVLAMLVIWLSTLGLYALMLIVGAGLSVAGVPGRLRDRIQERRN